MGEANPPNGRFAGLLRRTLRHPAIVPAVFGTGVVISLLSFAVIRGWERASIAQNATDTVREQVEQLRVTILRSMEVLYSINSFHAAQGNFDRAQFHKFVSEALSRQPELQALSWDPLVSATNRAKFEAAAAADGLAGFQFREANTGGTLVASSARDEYVPVYYIEPLDGNTGALGYDLSSDAARRRSLEAARDSGLPVATAPIRLAQKADRAAGFLVTLPVYRGPSPTTVAARRERLDGYAIAVFSVADLARGTFEQLRNKNIAAQLFDASTPRQLIHANDDFEGRGGAAGSSGEVTLDIPGRQWVVAYAPTPKFIAAQPHRGSWLVLIGGMVLTFLATAHLYAGWRWEREIAAANATLQEEVAVRRRAEAAAAFANQAKSDFLASMSHEIRTPLNAILGYTQLIRRDPHFSAEHQDAVSGISASGQHLLGLINEILDLSKIEAGRMELQLVDFDLAALGRGLAATFKLLCAEKRVGFRIVLDDDDGAIRVRGDEGKLRQVLINLLGNAVKFTQCGEVFLHFKPGANDRWLFEVIDTGLGIPEDEQANIFKPFYQGNTLQHHGGTGLGLAIAQRQVELLGGRLELHSERGIGSRFHFSIPLAPAITGETAAAAQPAIARLKAGCRIRALVVDDRVENRDILGRMLADVGCEVRLAAAGAEAVRMARDFEPKMVFLDWLMPGMDGDATARELLAGPGRDRLRIVAHSAAALSRYRDEARTAGCVDFIAKPIRAEEVYECLRRHAGAEFEFAEPAAAVETPGAWERAPMSLPNDLCARLATAAELHSTTALKLCLHELRQLGPEPGQLADHIRHLMRSYDMDEILRLISRATTPDFTTTPAPNGVINS